ncbi:MAG: C45 family peptidase [bacterium]
MAFLRKPLDLLDLKGDPCEIAFALGRRRRARIHRRVQFWDECLQAAYRGRRDTLRRLEAGFLREARRQCPAYLEELWAMAEGAQLPRAELFRLNLTELLAFAEKCTDLILPFRTPSGRGLLLAHNEDWDPRRNDVFILKARLPKLEYAVLAYDGYLPGLSAGINSFGLLHSVNYLRPKDFRLGLPRIFVTRHLVTARNFADCQGFLRRTRRAFGQAIHLAQEGRYLGLELTARSAASLRPRLPAAHTNHYLAAKLHPLAPGGQPPSLRRLETARRLLRESWPPGSKAATSGAEARRLARHILRDRSGLPWALWREADSPEEGSATLALVLLGTDRPELEIHRERPGRKSAIRIRLDRT